MKALEFHKYFKPVQKTNLNIFKKRLNQDLKLKVTDRDKITPFTIQPEKLYNDFNRDEYKRNRLKFPLNVPVYYRKIYRPNEYLRTKKPYRHEKNFAVYTGNELLLSLNQFDHYL